MKSTCEREKNRVNCILKFFFKYFPKVFFLRNTKVSNEIIYKNYLTFQNILVD